jgi:hypothetical protein
MSNLSYEHVREQACKLLGYDPTKLTEGQKLTVDIVTTLRLAVDDMTGAAAAGKSVDVTKLLAANDALVKLLPAASTLADQQEKYVIQPREALTKLVANALASACAHAEAQAKAEGKPSYEQLVEENERLRAVLGEKPMRPVLALPSPDAEAPSGDVVDVAATPPPDVWQSHLHSPQENAAFEAKRAAAPPPTPKPAPQPAPQPDLRASRSEGAGGGSGFEVRPYAADWAGPNGGFFFTGARGRAW